MLIISSSIPKGEYIFHLTVSVLSRTKVDGSVGTTKDPQKAETCENPE